MKCYLTHEKCTAVSAGYWDNGDSCPIGKYESSTRTGADGITIIDDNCRYCGISRYKELQKQFEGRKTTMAAAKKDFSNVNSRVRNALADATADTAADAAQEVQEVQQTRKTRRTYTKEETQEYLSDFRSSGRKGVKMPRINMAFTPENYEYIRIMSRVRGENLTEFLNVLVKKSMEENREVYEAAIKFRNSIE